MIIKKVNIENFKSISKIEIPFDKVDGSYTKIFVDINESGKSNILEALSYFDVPGDKMSFENYCNQKQEDSKSSDIYFSLEFEEDEGEALQNTVNKVVSSDYEINFSISNTIKHVYLASYSSTFEVEYNFDINLYDNNLYVKYSKVSGKDTISIVDDSNKPLYNIFKLSGYKDKNAIVDAIDKVSNPRNRSCLESKLNDSLNDYIGKVWKHNIDLIIGITETGSFSLLIKDKANKHDRFSITDRSQGAKQFLSLMLLLSIETTNHERKNELILIDEPEVHLHPSGIKDLAQELLKIGRDNYVFLATCSPFMIDKSHKERHYIVKKNASAITEIIRIKESYNLIDNEVLNEAFVINVYRDLMNHPYSILVEEASDKLILQKVFKILGREDVGITNKHGSNIDILASRMNFDGILVLVVTNDDKDGRMYKENILKMGGSFTTGTVFTIRDIEGEIINQGTIEDILGVKYVESQFIKYYKSAFDEEITDISLPENQPVFMQIATILKKKKKYSHWNMDAFKKQLFEEFQPIQTSFLPNLNC